MAGDKHDDPGVGLPESFTRKRSWLLGGSLLQEMSFVCFYHRTVPNQLMHVCTTLSIEFILSLLAARNGPAAWTVAIGGGWAVPLQCVALALVYTALHFTFDAKVAVWTAPFVPRRLALTASAVCCCVLRSACRVPN
jgi:hypothetical protein